jgi:omega-3 fatty acid desaturase (delta-15 desaturase)
LSALNSTFQVPFYPLKLSHQHHHKNTGNIDKDEIFYPIRQKEQQKGRRRRLN